MIEARRLLAVALPAWPVSAQDSESETEPKTWKVQPEERWPQRRARLIELSQKE